MEGFGGSAAGFAFDRRESQAVDGGVGVADFAQGIFELEAAAAIVRLAEKQDRAAIIRRLLLEKIDGKAEGVQDRCAAVSGAEAVDCAFERV